MWPLLVLRRGWIATLLLLVCAAAAPQQPLRARPAGMLNAHTDSELDLESAERPLQLAKRSPEPWMRRPAWRHPAAAESAAAGQDQQARDAEQALARTSSALAQQFLRTSRAGSLHTHRPYDVPQIECPPALDGMERFACPTQDALGRYRCIDDHMLCDGYQACPGGEDEDRQNCMFYKTTKSHLNVLAHALLRWVGGR